MAKVTRRDVEIKKINNVIEEKNARVACLREKQEEYTKEIVQVQSEINGLMRAKEILNSVPVKTLVIKKKEQADN